MERESFSSRLGFILISAGCEAMSGVSRLLRAYTEVPPSF